MKARVTRSRASRRLSPRRKAPGRNPSARAGRPGGRSSASCRAPGPSTRRTIRRPEDPRAADRQGRSAGGRAIMRGMSTPPRPTAEPERRPSPARSPSFPAETSSRFPPRRSTASGPMRRTRRRSRRSSRSKGRPADHPLIVHLAPEARLDDWAVDIPEAARKLAARLLARPAHADPAARRRACPRSSPAGRTSVGLRCPSHPVAQALLREFARAGSGAVAAPSANKFGHVSPTTAQHVRDEFGPDLLVLDGGACEVGLESTIVDLSRGDPVLLRPGARHARGHRARSWASMPRDRDADAPRASGTLASHYAPRTPLVLVDPALASGTGRERARGRQAPGGAGVPRPGAPRGCRRLVARWPPRRRRLRARPLREPARARRERCRPDRCRSSARRQRVGSRPRPPGAGGGRRRRRRRNLKGNP